MPKIKWPTSCFWPGIFSSGLFFLLFFTAFSLSAQALIPELKRDDFTYRHAWWQYHRDGIAKRDTQALRMGPGFLQIQLVNPSNKRECNVGISEFQNIYGKKYSYLSVELRVKLQNPLYPGSRGWGFWRSRKGNALHSLAWFMQQKDARQKALSWSLAGVVQGKRRQVKTWQPEIGAWHIYRIERDLQAKTTRFWVDDSLFMQSRGLVPRERLSFHLWIDNQVYSKNGIRRQQWNGRTAMIVDYVQVRTRRPVPAGKYPESAHLLLYQNFNKILHGPQEFEVGKYAFRSKGDRAILLLTARAEDLRPYDRPDRLAVFLDEATNPILTIDGTVLKGETRSYFKELSLNPGEHQLRLLASGTPLLYDVMLLDGQGANIELNLHDARDLRPQFIKHCTKNTGYVLYAAVTAREAPTFDQIHWQDETEQHDDDLTVLWQRKESKTVKKTVFCGNTMFGDCRTQILTGRLKPGDYVLTIQKEGHPQLHRLLLICWPEKP